MDTKNPNEYNDAAFTKASIEVTDAVGQMWEAGANFGNIAEDVANGIENAGGPRVHVVIQEI